MKEITAMATPVVLVGVDLERGRISAVGLYESTERARQAVILGEVPSGLTYSVMTPAMNSSVVPSVCDPVIGYCDTVERQE